MKKVLSLMLALCLVLSLSVVAFAAPSPTASQQNAKTTSSLPEYTLSEENQKANLKLTEYEKKDTELTEDQEKLFEDAKADVKNVTPDGMKCQYICYVTADEWPQDVTVKIDNVTEVSAKEYTTEGEWVDVTVTGTYTLTLEQEGVIAIFTK